MAEDFGAGEWDLNLQTNTTGTGDADFTLNRLYTCAAMRMGYCNEELDSILADARASLDPEERIALYEQASQIIWDDAVGVFPADLKINAAYQDDVVGFVCPPTRGRTSPSCRSTTDRQRPMGVSMTVPSSKRRRLAFGAITAV